jgi:hypothetical protein
MANTAISLRLSGISLQIKKEYSFRLTHLRGMAPLDRGAMDRTSLISNGMLEVGEDEGRSVEEVGEAAGRSVVEAGEDAGRSVGSRPEKSAAYPRSGGGGTPEMTTGAAGRRVMPATSWVGGVLLAAFLDFAEGRKNRPLGAEKPCRRCAMRWAVQMCWAVGPDADLERAFTNGLPGSSAHPQPRMEEKRQIFSGGGRPRIH